MCVDDTLNLEPCILTPQHTVTVAVVVVAVVASTSSYNTDRLTWSYSTLRS